jgi:integrase
MSEFEIATKNSVSFDHLSPWVECREMWLRSYGSEHTRRSYAQALDSLMDFAGVGFDRITKKVALEWMYHLKSLYKPATVVNRMAAVSSFFTYAMDYMVELNGIEKPLANQNPVQMRKARTKVTPYANARALSTSDVKQLLAQPDRRRTIGLRDYALLLGYLVLGRRNTEWRLARVCDFSVQNDGIFFSWSGKGHENESIEVPEEVWQALQVYIVESGGRGPFDFVFLDRFGKHPISDRRMLDIVKKYAGSAQIGNLRVHDLRHTSSMLMRQAGADLEEIRDFLKHSSLKTTAIYVHKIERTGGSRVNKVAQIVTGRKAKNQSRFCSDK